MLQELILVDENDNPVGYGEKMDVHKKGQLHRAFSIFVVNDKMNLNNSIVNHINGYVPKVYCDDRLSDDLDIKTILSNFKPGDEAKIVYERFGSIKETTLTFIQNPSYTISLFETNGLELDDMKKEARAAWLNSKE